MEKDTFGRVLQIGHAAIQQLLALQGDGDLGESVATAEGRRLKRSEEPAERLLRTVFGEHTIHSSSYWDDFHRDRMAQEQCVLHPHRALLGDYHPVTLAG